MTFDPGTVRLERVGQGKHIALFTLDRVHKANAYTPDMLRCFERHLSSAMADPGIRAAVVTGEGSKVFCAGADIPGLSGRSCEDALDLLSRRVFNQWADAPWPTIAAIRGPAVAGGLELALASDLRICSKDSWFAFPEIDLGLIPAAGGIGRLARIIGAARAKEVVLFGKKVDAELACRWGLVSRISDQVLEDVEVIAERLIRHDPLAVRLAKMVLQTTFGDPVDQTSEAMAQALLYKNRLAKGCRHED